MSDPTRPLAELDALPGLTWFDLRTAEEFHAGHIPGARSLPILDHDERARVSRVFYAEGLMPAKLLALEVAGPRLAVMARTIGAAPEPRALYCWRGGLRSGILGRLLADLGIPVHVLAGGYRAHRRAVVAHLQGALPPFTVLHGYTGTGKTRLLRRLAARGFPVLDLEAIGSHRGSTFGAVGLAPQPTQRQFESELVLRLRALPSPVLIEAESPALGTLTLPQPLCRAMRAGRRIFLELPRAARAALIAEEYGPHVGGAGGAALEPSFAYLAGRLPRAEIDALRELLAAGHVIEFADRLLERHYDPLYERWRRRATFDEHISAPDLETAETALLAVLGAAPAQLHSELEMAATMH